MFQLSSEEKQKVITICDNLSKLRFYRGLPHAFTEHGAIMVASLLNTDQAVKVSVYVVRAFVKLREMLSTHKQLAVKLAELERKLQKHDGQIMALIEAIRELMEPPPEPKRKLIGFQSEKEDP
jgi:alanine-alpha-ketoisovalerate/valine-pyruvate aminotransferase